MFYTSAPMAGANLIHDVGWLASASAASAEQLVLADEMIAQCLRIMDGIRVDDNTLATDVINDVGPGGSFLDSEHTRNNFRGESFFPRLWDRRPVGKRIPGEPAFIDRTIAETERLVREHRPTVNTQVWQNVKKILTKCCPATAENRILDEIQRGLKEEE